MYQAAQTLHHVACQVNVTKHITTLTEIVPQLLIQELTHPEAQHTAPLGDTSLSRHLPVDLELVTQSRLVPKSNDI